ncbi:hypothetical protein [Priestia megaterium]|uniref:hypothetical protein n=1 Tax=Priestia megaterium TaxID=1404 RepID=UPI001869264D|nr:hypothetical protein [Priestia megaterium]MBE2973402.1 hypothetical protein [Priestia megaterium]
MAELTEAIRGTAIHLIEDYLETLAVGNEKKASVQELNLNGSKLSFKAEVVSKQRNKLWAGQYITVYSITTTVTAEVDLLNIAGSDVKVCVNTPAGPACADIDDLARALAGVIGV